MPIMAHSSSPRRTMTTRSEAYAAVLIMSANFARAWRTHT
jgi:hypothetical protein